MKNITYFAVSVLLLCLFGCKSKQSLKDYQTVEISSTILDTIPENRLSNYKETIEKTYILGFILIESGGSTSANGPISLSRQNGSLKMDDTKKPLYDEKMQKLILNSDVSYKVDSKCLGMYQRRKTIITGILVEMLSEKERKYIESK